MRQEGQGLAAHHFQQQRATGNQQDVIDAGVGSIERIPGDANVLGDLVGGLEADAESAEPFTSGQFFSVQLLPILFRNHAESGKLVRFQCAVDRWELSARQFGELVHHVLVRVPVRRRAPPANLSAGLRIHSRYRTNCRGAHADALRP
jgi:hypothetical protein